MEGSGGNNEMTPERRGRKDESKNRNGRRKKWPRRKTEWREWNGQQNGYENNRMKRLIRDEKNEREQILGDGKESRRK